MIPFTKRFPKLEPFLRNPRLLSILGTGPIFWNPFEQYASVLTGDAVAGDVGLNKTFYNTDPKTQVVGTLDGFSRTVLPLDRELGTEDDESWADTAAAISDTETAVVKEGTYSVKVTMDADAESNATCTLGAPLDISSFFEQGNRTAFIVWVRVPQIIAGGVTGLNTLILKDADDDYLIWHFNPTNRPGFQTVDSWFPLVFPTDFFQESGTFDPTTLSKWQFNIVGTNGDIIYFDEAHFETQIEL